MINLILPKMQQVLSLSFNAKGQLEGYSVKEPVIMTVIACHYPKPVYIEV